MVFNSEVLYSLIDMKNLSWKAEKTYRNSFSGAQFFDQNLINTSDLIC